MQIFINAISTFVSFSAYTKAFSKNLISACNSVNFVFKSFLVLLYGFLIVSAFNKHIIAPPSFYISIALSKCLSPLENGGFMTIKSYFL